jgi:hypothetical protein
MLTFASYSVNGATAARPDFGAAIPFVLAIYNDWADANAVSGTLSTTDSYVNIIGNPAAFGNILSGQTVAAQAPLTVMIGAAAGYNHVIPFQLQLSANNGAYSLTVPFTVTTRSSVQSVSGTIAQNTVWTNDKTYVVSGNSLGVAPGVTLTIQPGTVVRFASNLSLNVGGTLIADGTAQQPIVFMPDTPGSAWNRVYFDDPSTDAVVDAIGSYSSGNVLRNVRVQGAAGGIVCNSATPYLSQLSTDAGGINCTLGAGDFWLLESSITGNVSVSGTGHVRRSAVTSGNLSLGAGSDVLTDSISGTNSITTSVTLGNNSSVVSSSTGDISINGYGTVQNCSAHGTVSLGSGNVVSNTVNGSITTGSGLVTGNQVAGGSISLSSGTIVSNTVKGGGIITGAAVSVHSNTTENALSTGIQAGAGASLVGNRVVGSGGTGIIATTGLLQGNLIANTAGDGVQVGGATVVSNTFTGIAGRALYLTGGFPLKIQDNNFEFNRGSYDLYNDNSAGAGSDVAAQGNWWGTTDIAAIGSRIYDFHLDYTKGNVIYTPPLPAPAQDAPAYVRSVTLNPPSPVGIQQVAFDVKYSRPMDPQGSPTLLFYTAKRGGWQRFDASNSGLSAGVNTIAADADDNIWFGTRGSGVKVLRGDGSWQSYVPSNSGLAGTDVRKVTFDPATGDLWFATNGQGVSLLRPDATWQTYNAANSGLAHDGVSDCELDSAGNVWFGTNGGASVLYANHTWQTFTTSNSGLASDVVQAVATDARGNRWFGTMGRGASVLRVDGTWHTYSPLSGYNNVWDIMPDDTGNVWLGVWDGGLQVQRPDGTWDRYMPGSSPILDDDGNTLGMDAAGAVWVGTQFGVSVLRRDGSWLAYTPQNSGLATPVVNALAIDAANNRWFGRWEVPGASVLWGGLDYPIVDSPRWLTPTEYQAAFDFTTLVPRDTFTVSVSGVRGSDGVEIAPYAGITFTVDYAGQVTVKTPPPAPIVTARGDGSLTTISGQWSAHDPNSTITGYRYAVGSTSGGTDVINWTDISSTQVVRSGLSLLVGQKYYVSAKARNAGGLWSTSGISNAVIAGQATRLVYLPLLRR